MLLVLGELRRSLKNLRKQRAGDESSTKASGEAANQGTPQHFLGGRSFGSIVTILTLCGTMYSGYSLIAVPADFGNNGFIGVRWFGNVSVQFGACCYSSGCVA